MGEVSGGLPDMKMGWTGCMMVSLEAVTDSPMGYGLLGQKAAREAFAYDFYLLLMGKTWHGVHGHV